MPPRLTRPVNVPASREPLVDLMWRFHVAAQRPPIRHIEETIKQSDEEQRNGTATYETIRRTLQGTQVGAFGTVEVVFLAVCELADVDPQDKDDVDYDYDSRYDPPPPTHIERLRQCWHQAVDDSPMPTVLKTRKDRADERAAELARSTTQPVNDQWGSMPPPAHGYADDEPPF